jgi:hypothetical protein
MKKVIRTKGVFVLTLVAILVSGFVGQNDAQGNVWTSLGPENEEVRSLAVSPSWTTDQTIVFGTWYQPGRFYRTSDGGTTWWSTQPLGNTSYSNVFDAIALSPNYQYGGLDQTVFLGGGNSAWVYLSTDSGNIWYRDTAGISGDKSTWDFAVSPSFETDGMVFVAGNNGIHKSVDGGITFVPVNNGLPGGSHLSLAISPNYSADQTIFVGTSYDIYKSTDGGNTWSPVGLGAPPDPWGQVWIYDLAISPNYANNHTIFAGVWTSGIYRSTDGGGTWSLVYPDAYVINSQSLAISPNYADDSTLFAGTTFHYGTWTGVVISQDGGDTWSQMDNTGLSSRALSSTPDIIVSPDFIVDQQIFIGTRDGVWTTTVSPTNTSPIADAGPDKTEDEGTLVTLDGSGSSDPENDPLTYNWTQVAGSSVALDVTDPIHPSFTAPWVTAGGETLTFKLIVSDGELDSDPDCVDITVKNVNNPPVADAGDDKTVQEDSLVMLNGSASYDLDNEPLTYSWVQTAGSLVTLSDDDTATPSFTAPFVGSAGETLTFELSVSDGIDTATDTVDVFVENMNHQPIADAGSARTVDEGVTVILNGSGSSDPDNDPLTFAWTQIVGSTVILSDSTAANPTFTAPSGADTLRFQLIVNDGEVNSDPDMVTITVLASNDPPACGLAQASPDRFWPPNHKMVPVEIVGVIDPDNEQVTITVTGVTQDEPVNNTGDGDTSPDAVIQADTVLLRAERAGDGNGRVYQVTFTADNGIGGTCDGSVSVCVPHNRKATGCVDDGQFYNSQ